MFFILSKLLIVLIYPLTWILVALLIAIVSKVPVRKKKYFIISFILLIIFTDPLLLDLVARKWDVAPVSEAQLTKTDCVIVLGGFSSEDFQHQGYFNASADRFVEALKLRSNGIAGHILVTGGNASLVPTKFREADWVQQQLREFKVPDSAFIIEDRSRNSMENATFCKKILDSLHFSPPYILVTSGYHMRRSLYIFRKLGLNVNPYPANYIAGRQPLSLSQLVPEAGILGGWNFYIKEMIGYLAYRIKSR